MLMYYIVSSAANCHAQTWYKEDENAVYDPNQIYVHRIVEINEVGDRVLFTRGDNNPDEDSPAVYKGGYIPMHACL